MTARRPSNHLAFETPEHSVPPSPTLNPTSGNGTGFQDDSQPVLSYPEPASYPLPLQRHEKQAQNIIESVTESSKVAPSGVLSYLLRLQSEKANTVIDMDDTDPFAKSSAFEHEMHTLSSNRKNRQFNDARRASVKEEQQNKIKESIADVLTKNSLILKLSSALVMYGAPAHRIEDALETVSNALGVKASFAYSPGMMMISFVDMATRTSETHHLRQSDGFDLYRLELVYHLMRHICHGNISVGAAYRDLESIMKRPPYHSRPVYLTSYTASTALVAAIAFRGSWFDMLASAAGGTICGVLSLLSGSRFSTFSNVYQVLASFLVGVLARGLHDYICYQTVILSSLAVLLPGFQLTLSLMEITSQSVNSGTTRLISAIMNAFFQAFGAWIGIAVFDIFEPGVTLNAAKCYEPISPWFYFLVFPPLSLAINVQFGASWRHMPICIIVNAAAFVVVYFMSNVTTSNILPVGVAAFVIGLICNLYGKFTHQLGFVPVMGAVLILVPGSVGVRAALTMLLENQLDAGFGFALQMILVASGLTVGLFASTFICHPTGKKSVLLAF